MTACFVRPTTTQLYQSLSALFSANVLGGAPIIPESNEYYLLGNDVAAAELYYSLSAQQWEQTQDETACCDALIANNAPLGLIPKGATFTQLYIQCTGPAFSPVPPNLQCQIGSQTYNLSTATNANPPTLDNTGQAILLMTSLVPGTQVNFDTNSAITSIAAAVPGITATLTIVPPGWATTVTTQGNGCGGLDAETCDQFRARVIARKQFTPNADFAYIQEQALNWPCITRVLLRTCQTCCNDGQMELYAFADDSFPYGILPASALPGLNTYIFGSTPGLGTGKAPIGIFGNFFQVFTSTVNLNFFNMSCVSAAQFTQIQNALAALFATFAPGEVICVKLIDAVVIGINPACCNYVLEVTPTDKNITIDCFGDITPLCDILPILGTISYTAAAPPA